ncbi:ribosomal RNA small subunit methyltransferase E [Spirochaetia bacterium]|nr:ribosomal RNA small subunit methyltransferase E [Spirochaetia bacterium]
MKQFILTDQPDVSGSLRITGRDFHYLVHVRRAALNDILNAALPSGGLCRLRITQINTDSLLCEIINQDNPAQKKNEKEKPQHPAIILFQAMPKGAKLDLIVRQAAELELSEIVPFYSEHSVPRPKDGCVRMERLHRIVKEARQQSGSQIQTVVKPPLDFSLMRGYWNSINIKHKKTTGFLLQETSLEKNTFHEYLDMEAAAVVLAVGPEGGFSAGEVKEFASMGFIPIKLGGAILRTETSALYAAAVVRTLILEKALWKSCASV